MNFNISESQAWSLYEAKKYAESAQIWENLLKSTSKNSEEHTMLLNGYVYALVAMKRFDEARKIHRDSFEKFKDHIDLHQLAYVEREAGDYQQALKYIHDERVLISAEEWNYLGANSYELGKLNELLGNLDLALEFAKKCEEESNRSLDLVLKACAQRLLGDIYSRFEKLSAALSHYEASKKFFEEAVDPIGVEEIMNTIAKHEHPFGNMKITPPSEKDLPRISEIESACYHPDLVTSLKGFQEFVSSQGENDFLLCAKDENSGEILGFICFSIQNPKPEVSTIWDLSVDPKFRSRKIGRRLMEKAIDLVRGQTPTISLHVPKGNIPAVKLYENLGFEKIKTLNAYYPGNEDGWVMVKSLL